MITIYSTYPDHEEAGRVSKALLEARLVACANIFPVHESLYWWKGTIENAKEVAVIYKSHDELFETIKDKITRLHSYDVPCIVAWEIERGHKDFLRWIKDETST